MARRRNRCSKWRTVAVAGSLCLAVGITVPDMARGEGIFDFLFGGFPQQPAPPTSLNAHPPPPPAVGRVAPPPLGQERVNEGNSGTGRAVAFCVRLCDGQHFAMERTISATPLDSCRAICPSSKTKVFFGSDIGGAVAKDGQHYSDLGTAFLYRKQLVANCTCNGKDAFGLATIDIQNDPTLRPGDIVSTKEGLRTYTGKSGEAAFAPVNPASLPADVSPDSSQLPVLPRTEPAANDQAQTTARPTSR